VSVRGRLWGKGLGGLRVEAVNTGVTERHGGEGTEGGREHIGVSLFNLIPAVLFRSTVRLNGASGRRHGEHIATGTTHPILQDSNRCAGGTICRLVGVTVGGITTR
jgi:hypothetical protein